MIVTYIIMAILAVLSVFFLFPKMVYLCESFVEIVADCIKESTVIKDTLQEWKDLFKRVTK